MTARAPSPQVGGLASIPARSEDGEVALFKQLPRRVSVLVVVRRALLFMLASLWAIPFLPMPAARSQTTVSGRIEQDTAWTQDSSPFVLIGQVVVVADVTLTIEPGVQVRGTAGSSLVVNGALNAVGTQGQRIIFTSDSGQQDWSGIHVAASVESSPSPSALRFVTIERAREGSSGARPVPGWSSATTSSTAMGLHWYSTIRLAGPWFSGASSRTMALR